jgi:hypothetical protein
MRQFSKEAACKMGMFDMAMAKTWLSIKEANEIKGETSAIC